MNRDLAPDYWCDVCWLKVHRDSCGRALDRWFKKVLSPPLRWQGEGTFNPPCVRRASP